MGNDVAVLMSMYETLLRCRHVEEVSLQLFEGGLTPGRMHPYIGEEAVAAGTAAAMRRGDLVVSTHRGGAHLAALNADVSRVFAEYMGRETGYSGGRGGPMHISVPDIGFLCTNGIVGSGIPVAVGAAMACQRTSPGKVVVCFFGDGAANTGSFHEGLNMAGIWKLPVVFICENNGYAETLPVAKGIAIPNISSRADGYGIQGVTVDGNDVEAVHAEASRALERARSGEGASLVEAKTYRIGQHFSGESNHYRTESEVEAWKKRDPVRLFRESLLERGTATSRELQELEERVRAQIEDAAREAKDAPFPEADRALERVYRDPQSIGVDTP
jgi:TPP-dependent pyruvate/acetoin dehydrogenase alpha subunit